MEWFILHVHVPLYSLWRVQLTCKSCFLETIDDKPCRNIYHGGQRIYNKKHTWWNCCSSQLDVANLSMLPFLDGRMQLPAEEVQKGRKNGSLHVHVERAIGRMKIYDILKVTNIFIPITIVRHINQIVCVHCMWITALVPPWSSLREWRWRLFSGHARWLWWWSTCR